MVTVKPINKNSLIKAGVRNFKARGRNFLDLSHM